MIFVDAENQIFKEITTNTQDAFQNYLKDTPTMAYQFKGDDLYAEDNGISRQKSYGYTIKGSHQSFFIGNALIFGTDENGGESDVGMSLMETQELISFITIGR